MGLAIEGHTSIFIGDNPRFVMDGHIYNGFTMKGYNTFIYLTTLGLRWVLHILQS